MNNQPQDNHRGTAASGTLAPPAVTGTVASQRSVVSSPPHGGASVSLAAVEGEDDRKRDACAARSRPVTEFRVARRRLPHWQAPGEVYFVTFRTAGKRVLQPQERDIALAACRFWDGKKTELYAVVVMPDHVHLLLQPRPVDHHPGAVYDLAEVLHSIKSFSAHEIAKRSEIRGAVWQHESYDRIVRDETEFDEKWTYICNNAVMKKLACEPGQYPWFWFPDGMSLTAASGTLAPPSPEPHESSGGATVPVVAGGATVPVAVVKPGNRL